ncbi:pyruvate dehydrogenase protein x component [Metarhizium album ARSEF 1941]|uniref:Pyruvate dehydrogenase protein x component n=1 Tax=Metarhizium album (strain ARSEF 1941) TaxID=1081103 RepID=A0A0B2X2R1_METAS|nr:pyruvate dehydrogenase protein x component [Metarhizium album ARSEF 1941]KHN99565.1 pyruvate dehydrogenase protein x component [Metarhizium album ARSEF 1941]
MPALSPTMTEGNIATWKVGEGETFSAGDVLLEIETDKATMDVEAQDDGIVMKIMAQDGAKAVQVGTRIAVLAEAGDDISMLEIPADEQQQQQQSSNESAAAPGRAEAVPEKQAKHTARASTGESQAQKYPLMPSVEHLVKQNGLSKDDVGKIIPTGPGGRLLKGDVLAYLGSIDADSPAAASSRFDRLSRLDLSNIKVAERKHAAAAPEEPKPREPELLPMEINVPVSLGKVVEVQERIRKTLGVLMPLSTFISRAAEVANDNLPPANRAPTASELFDRVLGLDKIKAAKGTRGVYLPQISAVPPGTRFEPPERSATKMDIIDELAAEPTKVVRERGIRTVPGFSNGLNVFSLVVPREEEHRAHVFLERCKAILEKEPGRLVL